MVKRFETVKECLYEFIRRTYDDEDDAIDENAFIFSKNGSSETPVAQSCVTIKKVKGKIINSKHPTVTCLIIMDMIPHGDEKEEIFTVTKWIEFLKKVENPENIPIIYGKYIWFDLDEVAFYGYPEFINSAITSEVNKKHILLH